MKLALKIDASTLRGTRDGVPRLADLFRRHGAGATFFFSLGPDRTGAALRRILRTLLPGPDIGRRCSSVMRTVRDAGFEVGIHCWDRMRWRDGVRLADADWTGREMQRAAECFDEVLQEKPRAWSAADWQTNRHAAWFEECRFDYASDTRGWCPFRPLWDGAAIGCPQLPTTLPAMDELIGLDDIDDRTVVQHLLNLTADPMAHVFTARAEHEGGALLGAFDQLLAGWKEQGYELVSLRSLFESLDPAQLPRHDIVYGEVPGRSGSVAMQAA